VRKLGIAPADAEPWAGIIVANVSHLAAVIILYELTLLLFSSKSNASRMAFVSASLHIISPAGLFLVAPYAESPSSMLQFLGYLFYVQSWNAERKQLSLLRDVLLLGSGAVIGLATAIRGNCILTGLLFAYDAVRVGLELLRGCSFFSTTRKLFVIIVSGSTIGLGAILWQYVAYLEYCTMPSIEARSWCSAVPPSIYTFVQSHYW
jgi:phosphatidylinositol glycan class V